VEALGLLGRRDEPIGRALVAAFGDSWVVRTLAAQALVSLGWSGPPVTQALLIALHADYSSALGHAAKSLWRVSAGSRLPVRAKHTPRDVREIHRWCQEQLLSLVSGTQASWWRRFSRRFWPKPNDPPMPTRIMMYSGKLRRLPDDSDPDVPLTD
jgi:hypothetical protein